MTPELFYFLHQVTRFGVMTGPQILCVCEGIWKRSNTYRWLKYLITEGYVDVISNPRRPQVYAYAATNKAHQVIYGENGREYIEIKRQDLDHSIAVTQTMLSLATYEYVIGISNEREMSPTEIKAFTLSRIPDGIAAVHQEGRQFEVAIEVETMLKSISRIQSILTNYKETLQSSGYLCKGVIIVATKHVIFSRYEQEIATWPETIRSYVRLFQDTGLTTLSERAFGPRGSSIGKRLERLRTQSNGQPAYIPIVSEPYNIFSPKKGYPVSDRVTDGNFDS